MMELQLDPHNLEAEHAVLGSMLIDSHCIPNVVVKLCVNDFYIKANGDIYETISQMTKASETIDPVTVLDKMKEFGVYNDDSPGYIRDLMLITPTSSNAMEYVKILKKVSARRHLLQLADEAKDRLIAREPVTETAMWLRNESAAIAARAANRSLLSSTDVLLKFQKYRVDLEKGLRKAVVSTGYPRLDKILGGGLANEGLYFLGARPGIGKTTLALNIADRIASRKVPTCLISLEMSIDQITAKRLAIESGISSTALLNNPDTSQEQWQRLNAASQKLATHHLLINNTSTATVDEIEQMATQVEGLGLLVIDYFGLIMHTGGKTLPEKLEHTSNALKRLARSLGVPVLCLAQLNREVESRPGGEPRISDLRYSGAAEQDADGVILLHRYNSEATDETTPVPLKVIVGKNRHGEVGHTDMNLYLINGRIK